jgi:hypothetical protein
VDEGKEHIAHSRQELQLKIWHFWVIGIERNVCRCTFNRYSVITQFAKLAAGEQLCRRCTHRKLYHFKRFKSYSWKITDFELWHSCCKWVILNYITVYRLFTTQHHVDTYLIVSVLFHLERAVGSRQNSKWRIYLFHKNSCFSFLQVISARRPHTTWCIQWNNAHRTFVARQPRVIYRVFCILLCI